MLILAQRMLQLNATEQEQKQKSDNPVFLLELRFPPSPSFKQIGLNCNLWEYLNISNNFLLQRGWNILYYLLIIYVIIYFLIISLISSVRQTELDI